MLRTSVWHFGILCKQHRLNEFHFCLSLHTIWALVDKNLRSQVFSCSFLNKKQYQALAHFAVWLHWNIICHFQTYQGSQAYTQFPFKEKKMEVPLRIFLWAVMLVACMKKNGMMILLKKFQSKKMMFWWSFGILMVHQYIFISLLLRINVAWQ